MDERAVKKYIEAKDLFGKFELERLGDGNNSNVFILKTGKKKYTLRLERRDASSSNSYKNHFLTLRFLEYSQIDFAPKPVYLNEKDGVLISTFVPGSPITETGLKPKQLELFVKQLVELNSLKYGEYSKFLKKEKIKIPTVDSPLDNIKKFGVKRFKEVQRICPDVGMTAWIKPKLEENIMFIKSQKWSKDDLIFNHGDLTGANVISNKNKLYFIDWDRARFEYNLNRDLSYLFIHFDFFNQHREQIIKLYQNFSKKRIKNFEEKIFAGMKIVKINDIIWAAKAYSETCGSNSNEHKKYYELFYKRVEEYGRLM